MSVVKCFQPSFARFPKITGPKGPGKIGLDGHCLVRLYPPLGQRAFFWTSENTFKGALQNKVPIVYDDEN